MLTRPKTSNIHTEERIVPSNGTTGIGTTTNQSLQLKCEYSLYRIKKCSQEKMTLEKNICFGVQCSLPYFVGIIIFTLYIYLSNSREEIKCRINLGNACYYSLEKILSSRLLCKKLKVNTYKTIILPVVLYGCETWSLTVREEHRLRVFENKVLRRYLGLKE